MKYAVFVLCAALAGCKGSQSAAWNKTNVMIPMRDGVKLHTLVFVPAKASGKLPFLIERSPYGFDNGRDERTLGTRYKELADEGFIFVLQDIRGRYGSEGQFVMQRPIHDRSKRDSIDEGTDTYDTIEWLLKNVPGNNGRAGLLGISYGGWLTVMALIEPHPALKAASEQASPADMFLGDDFHHNGAFRLSYGFEYVARMETGKIQSHFDFDKYDTYKWYLSLGPLSPIDKL
jgi:putative CocE/NonD family hydrolase